MAGFAGAVERAEAHSPVADKSSPLSTLFVRMGLRRPWASTEGSPKYRDVRRTALIRRQWFW